MRGGNSPPFRSIMLLKLPPTVSWSRMWTAARRGMANYPKTDIIGW